MCMNSKLEVQVILQWKKGLTKVCVSVWPVVCLWVCAGFSSVPLHLLDGPDSPALSWFPSGSSCLPERKKRGLEKHFVTLAAVWT